jgi:CubicO group peptidase (beta-lactamase class C family)
MNRRGLIQGGGAACVAGMFEPRPPLTLGSRDEGFSSQGLSSMDAHFAAAVAAGQRAGYVICLGRAGTPLHQSAIGVSDLERRTPMTPHTLFRIASLTKLVTSVATLQLMEEGRLELDDPVGRYIPEIGAMQVAISPETPDERRPPARPMTIRHLMLHLSGIGYRFDAASELGRRYQSLELFHRPGTLAEAVRALAELPLYADPGDRVIYSFSTDVLGRLVEVVSGEPFASRIGRKILNPLGMHDTGFHLSEARRSELATVYLTAADGSLEASDTEVFGDPFDAERWTSGGAGLISTGPDYLRFLMALERRGPLGGARILSPATVDLLSRNHLPPNVLARLDATPLAGLGFGLGSAVVLDSARAAGHYGDGDCFWSGHFDTQYLFSHSTGLAAVIMTQWRETPGSPPSRTAADLRALAYGALSS